MTDAQNTDNRVARLSDGRLKLDGPAFRKGVPLAIAGFWLGSLVLFAATRVAPSEAESRVPTRPAVAAHALNATHGAVAPSSAALMDNAPGHGIASARLIPAAAHTPPGAIQPRPSTATTPPKPKHTARHAHAKAKAKPTPHVAKATYVAPKPAAPAGPAHTMQVWVTGYDLTGTTATGTQAGPGVCAVDPYVIPLYTHLSIAGVGSCTALDIGPAVAGAHIDVWVPDYQTALNLTGWYTATW